MTLTLTKRSDVAQPLTAVQHDANFDAIMSAVNAKLDTASLGALGAKNTVDATELIADAVVTLAKLAAFTQGKLLGRAPAAGTGVPTLIDLTAFGQSLLNLADAPAGRSTLGVDVGLGTRTITGSATLALSDNGLIIICNSASATNVTVPPQASVAWPANSVVHVFQLNTGAVTLVPGSGVALTQSADLTLTLRNQYSLVSMWRRASNIWHPFGGLGVA